MKKLIIILSLLTSTCFGISFTNQAACTNWLGRELTDNEIAYYKFLVPKERARQEDRILVGYAYVECPVAMLKTKIPQNYLDKVHGRKKNDSGEDIGSNVTDLELDQFSLIVWRSLDGKKAIVRMGARDILTGGRRDYLSADELADWDAGAGGFGYNANQWLTVEEYKALRASDKYTEEQP